MFPYKSTFVTTDPSCLLKNLKTCKDLIQPIYAKNQLYPVAMISEEKVYETVNIITDLYTEYARMNARLFQKLSPLEYWKKYETDVRREARKRFGNETNFSLREVMYFCCKEATAFSPVLSKCVYDHLLPERGGSVLDPFSGWGDRAIGSLGSDRVIKYQGVDCNMLLEKGYADLKSDLDSTNKLNFVLMPFEDFKTDESYDLIFTSPPYYDFEIYSNDSTQSISGIDGKRTYKNWFTDWMTPVLKKMEKLLKHGGVIALHVGSTFRTPTLHDDIWEVLTQECNLCYIQEIQCSLRGKRPIPIWVYAKH